MCRSKIPETNNNKKYKRRAACAAQRYLKQTTTRNIRNCHNHDLSVGNCEAKTIETLVDEIDWDISVRILFFGVEIEKEKERGGRVRAGCNLTLQ